jgi:hypothetical protein
MGFCIAPQALLSALVHRAQHEGYVPTRADVEAVIAAGCSKEEVVRMFDRVGGEAAKLAREITSV